MIPEARPTEDDQAPPPAEDPPGAMVWTIIGAALVLAYIVALALLRPTA